MKKLKTESLLKYDLKDKSFNPYKIFDIDIDIETDKPSIKKKRVQTAKNVVHSYRFFSPDISKKVKELALSNDKYINYISSYEKITKESAFMTPNTLYYPIRKNVQYTPISFTSKVKMEKMPKTKNFLFKYSGMKQNNNVNATNIFNNTNNTTNSNYTNNGINIFNNITEDNLNTEGNIEETSYGFKYKGTKIITDLSKYKNSFEQDKSNKTKINNNSYVFNKTNIDFNRKNSFDKNKNNQNKFYKDNNYKNFYKRYKSSYSRNKKRDMLEKKNIFFNNLTDGTFFQNPNKTNNIYKPVETDINNVHNEEYFPYDLQYTKNTNKDFMLKKEKNILFLLSEIKHISNNINNNIYNKKTTFNINSHFKKKYNIKLEIKSICLEFKELDLNENEKENNNGKIKQKIYLPFNFLPLFYMLDFISFKCFLSEVIKYDIAQNIFLLNNEKMNNVLKKYIENAQKYFINYSVIKEKNKTNIFHEITYNENENKYKTEFDWVIFNNKNNKNGSNKIFKMSIIFPKIKYNINELKIKIRKYINKELMIQLLKKQFINWNKYILFCLFIIKKFRLLMNNVLLHKSDLYENKKIYLDDINNIKENKKSNPSNIIYDFFITNVDSKVTNYFYFLPNTVIMTYLINNKEFKTKIIQLSIKETSIIRRVSKLLSINNIITRCIFISRETNKASLRLDLFDNVSEDFIKLLEKENKIRLEKEKEKKNEKSKENINIKINKIFKKIINNANEKENVIKYKIDGNEVNVILREPKIINIKASRDKIELYYLDIPEVMLENILENNDNSKCLFNHTKEILKNLDNFEINNSINWNNFNKENIYLMIQPKSKDKIRKTVIEKNFNGKLLFKKMNKKIQMAKTGAKLINEWKNNIKANRRKSLDKTNDLNNRKFSFNINQKNIFNAFMDKDN